MLYQVPVLCLLVQRVASRQRAFLGAEDNVPFNTYDSYFFPSFFVQPIRKGRSRYDTFPKKEWPQCPAEPPAPLRTVAHPYLKGVYFKEKPIVNYQSVKVTFDGRLGEFNRDKTYTYTDPPLNIPPWFRPRYKSVEIRGGIVMNGCDCWRKNGLQDDCQRWDCQRPECLTQPLPECPPAANPPFNGIRKPNAFML